MSLGQRIRHLRQSRGLTQSELGSQELSKSFISLLEKDRTQPSLQTLKLLARRLSVSVDSLLGHSSHPAEGIAQGLLVLSQEAIRDQRFERAAKFLDMARFVGEGLDEVLREADLQGAELALEQRAFADAWEGLQGAIASNRSAADYWRLGRAQVLMGWLKLRQREFLAAEQVLIQALATLRKGRSGRDPARVEALIALGGTLIYMGKYSAAVRRYKEAVRSDVAQREPKLRARGLWGIGLAFRKLGDHASARYYILQAKDVFESIEEIPDYVRVLKALGQLHYEQGNGREALRYLHRALRAAERLKMRVIHASTLTEIARVNATLNNLEDAEHFAQQAFVQAREVDDPVEVAEASWVLAKIAAERNDHPAAIHHYKQALTTFKQRKMAAKGAEVARELGLLLRGRRAYAQAAAYLAMALQEEGKEVSAASE